MDERNVLIILNLSGNIDPVELYVRNRSPDLICSTGGYHASTVQTDDNMGTDG